MQNKMVEVRNGKFRNHEGEEIEKEIVRQKRMEENCRRSQDTRKPMKLDSRDGDQSFPTKSIMKTSNEAAIAMKLIFVNEIMVTRTILVERWKCH